MTWLHLRLPMEYESQPSCQCGTCVGVNAFGWKDWRTVDGEVIHPRFTKEFLDAERIRLGSMGYAGQMQQRPLPEGGGLFSLSCFERRWTSLPEEVDRVVVAVDANFKAGTASDFAVIQVWLAAGSDRYLVEQWRKQADFVELRDALAGVIARYPYAKVTIEDAANGIAIISELARHFAGIVPVKPDGGKRSRALSVQGVIESGAVLLPKNAPWVGAWLSEVCSFTGNGDAHDDQVDAMVYGLRDLQEDDALAQMRRVNESLAALLR